MKIVSIIISVVICTYNRSEILKGCLHSLIQQNLKKSKFEIIVVDNNSSDNTRQVVEAFLERENIRYFVEIPLGLSHARNRGLKESKGQYVAYMDDDARAAIDWLQVAYGAINSIQPQVDCFSGPCHPFYTTPKPKWFNDQYEIRGSWDAPKYLRKDEYISGSNMIWAKDALNKIGGFDVNTGVAGNHLRLGEETKAFEYLWSFPEQPRFYYLPNLIVYHWVPAFKMTVSYRLKRQFAAGQYQAHQLELEGGLNIFKIIGEQLFYLIKSIFRFLLRSKFHSYWQNWVVEDGARIAYYLGKLLGLLGIKPRIS